MDIILRHLALKNEDIYINISQNSNDVRCGYFNVQMMHLLKINSHNNENSSFNHETRQGHFFRATWSTFNTKPSS